ncbi:F0F1 ATP synthase subunit alpha [Candidatus Gottesmanbacteria bacterium RIFCSPLOWO2_01_FULL_39_12b]|uniref:ATP synthase subunit alpha n=1 Tax=Candidatus Gottesmanbacteria bacterium RIFCSPLOWO2_01_FULL_39_12b TaxID=1798388 RepID=A0A1F6AQN3_9BACT|nr:MAG: F0F1 ATP synthase subunit alpha [Candidatus Gottesmanbacteria bacterium RIFCSPLOWO2_01_FULL_39_12b]
MSSGSKLVTKILEKLATYQPKIEEQLTGKIIAVADGVAKVSGLYGVSYLEMVEFPHGVFGVAINLEEKQVGVIVLGDYLKLQEGDEVKNTGKLLSIAVGEELIGRVIDPIGNPLDGKGEIRSKKNYPIEKVAPGVIARQPVNTSLATGIKAIDAMIPIGRGQRELIIGDRGVGKTQIALDTIINQKEEKVICIYVAIGQKASRVAQVISELEKNHALSHTIIVAANASDPASYQYLAPYAGCAIGEYFMDLGRDALVIYDDLSKHAWAYRQISLILRRPSGREAYPGDVFYLHSRLLERACRLNQEHGGGSLTALPIIETLAGDLSSYIPTNVISITDGQIYLEPDLFYSGMRPAISVGASVSRVGGSAQIKAMKQVAGRLRLDLAQYRELAAFAQFSSDLDAATKNQIERGSRMTQLLKQATFKPMQVELQIALLWAGVNGFLDDIATNDITQFETEYLEYLQTSERKLLKSIKEEKKLSEDIEKKLKKAVEDFKKSWQVKK